MKRKIAIQITLVYFVILILLGFMLYRASPGPAAQDILGVGLGNNASAGGLVYLSGRHLKCVSIANSDYTSKCSVIIAGKTLEILARRNATSDPVLMGGKCEAYYADRQWSCQIGSRHVHVHWFAYIPDALGLTPSQLDQLRQQYVLENLPEAFYFPYGSLIIALTVMIAMMVGLGAWLWPKLRSKILILLIIVMSGLASFIGTFFIFAFVLTNGFWD